MVLACALESGTGGASEVRDDRQLHSPALGRDISYSIYLPDGHERTDARFPVVYLLHGYGGGRREWFNGGHLAERLDDLIATGEIPPLIAVTPEAGKSWYVDSARYGGPGDFETAIMHDLIEGIDRIYPTLADRNYRAIAGISMGGHGALRFAFAHPERFTAVAALSPAIWKSGGVSWALSPQFTTEDAFEKWFPRITGETFDAATFHAQSPFAMIGNLASLEVVPRIMLTVGDDDYWKLHDGTVELYLDLRTHGLDPELRVTDGAHNWRHWRAMIDPVLLFISRDWHSSATDVTAPITQ